MLKADPGFVPGFVVNARVMRDAQPLAGEPGSIH
jgi:hypothetical protein